MTTVLLSNFDEAVKGAILLKASLDKFIPLDPEKKYSPEELEPYDALASRFERLVDLITSGLFRGLEIYFFADTSENFRDRLLRMEKSGFISDKELWIEIRLLRNKIAHTYIPQERMDVFESIIQHSSEIFLTIERVRKRLIDDRLIDT